MADYNSDRTGANIDATLDKVDALVDSGNNVTANSLTVDGNGLFKSLQPKITLEDTSISGADKFVIQSASGQVDGDYDFIRNNDATSASDYKTMTLKGNGDVHWYEDTGTTAKMTWDSSAESLGIGTSSPLASLDVASAQGNVGFNYGTSSSPERANLWYDTDGTGWVFNIGKVQSGAFTSQVTIKDNGNVGIGTASPSLPLDVHGGTIGVTSSTAFSGLQITSANNSFAYVNFGDSDDGNIGQIRYDHSSNAMITKTNNSERARTDSSGNLLVGTTSTNRGQLVVQPSSTSRVATHLISPSSQPVTSTRPHVLEGIVYLDTVSLGSVITLPFTSQGSVNIRHLVELRWYSEEYNATATTGAGRALISVRSLGTLGKTVLESSGNFSSVTSTGTDLNITVASPFTGGLSNYEGAVVYYKILTSRPDFVEVQNLALN